MTGYLLNSEVYLHQVDTPVQVLSELSAEYSVGMGMNFWGMGVGGLGGVRKKCAEVGMNSEEIGGVGYET